MNPKRSSIQWGIGDYATHYSTNNGGSPATNRVSSIGSGSITVTNTRIREGQYLFCIVSSNSTGDISGNFVAQATSSGLTANYVVLSGTEFFSTGGASVAVLATDGIINVGSSAFTIQDITSWNISTNVVTVTTAVALADVLIFMGTDSSTKYPTKYFISEALEAGTANVDYRYLAGTEFSTGTQTDTVLFSFQSKYNVCSLEGIDVAEIVKVEDPENGQWYPAKSTWEFENAKNNYMNDGSLLYYVQDLNRLFVYRGITTTNGCFIRVPMVHYLTQPPTNVENKPNE